VGKRFFSSITIGDERVREIMNIKYKNSNANVSKIGKGIDYIIYQIFDLTEEDIAIIENKSPPA
jgi:hypothetical protein